MRTAGRPSAAGYKADEGDVIVRFDRERIRCKLAVDGDPDMRHQRAKRRNICREESAKLFARRAGLNGNLDFFAASGLCFCSKEFDDQIHGYSIDEGEVGLTRQQ